MYSVRRLEIIPFTSCRWDHHSHHRRIFSFHSSLADMSVPSQRYSGASHQFRESVVYEVSDLGEGDMSTVVVPPPFSANYPRRWDPFESPRPQPWKQCDTVDPPVMIRARISDVSLHSEVICFCAVVPCRLPRAKWLSGIDSVRYVCKQPLSHLHVTK